MRGARAVVGVCVGVAWFGWVGPEVAGELPKWRPPRPQAQAVSAGPSGGVATTEEGRWGAQVAEVLTEAQRAEGLAKKGTVGDLPPSPQFPMLDGDLLAVARRLATELPYGEAPPVPVPPKDAWGSTPRKDRALALMALWEAGALTEEQARRVLRVTLEELDREGGQ